jgi:uncharacterized hydrophobic protein (TIGR00341 family)
MFNIFSSTERLKNKITKQLENYSRPNKDFFILIFFSSAIISLGLILDNSPIIIGGMIIAPLITPFFGLALNLILLKIKDFFKSLFIIFLGSIAVILISTITGFIILLLNNKIFLDTTEILERTNNDFAYFLVALLIGLVGAYAYTKPDVSEKIIGIAISAAIVPPLATTGLGIVGQNIFIIKNSLFLFLINFSGIFLGSIFIFLILGFSKESQD